MGENRSKKSAYTALFFIIAIITLSSFIISSEPENILYMLFLDWLQGKPSGLIKLYLNIPDKGICYVLIINYTKVPGKIIYSSRHVNFVTITFKVWRIPKRVDHINGKTVVRYFEQTYYIFVRTCDKIYSKLVTIEPEKPITIINVKPRFVRKVPPITLSSNPTSYYMGITYNYQSVIVGEYHLIQGISISWGFTSGDEYRKIKIEFYEREASIRGEDYLAYKRGEYNLNKLSWSEPSSPGKSLVGIECIGRTANVSGRTCARVMGQVRYCYDMFCIEYPDDLTADFILTMMPVELTGYWKDGMFSCSKCGSRASSSYAGIIESGASEGIIVLGSEEGYRSWSVFLKFNIGINVTCPEQYSGTIVSIEFIFANTVSDFGIYYEAKPKIRVVKNSGYIDKDLYYWFEGNFFC